MVLNTNKQIYFDEISETIQKIITTLFLYPIIYQNIRRILLNKFPFDTYYFIDNDSIIIIAIMYGSRHPNQWKKRK